LTLAGGLNVGQWLADGIADLIRQSRQLCADIPVAGRVCLDLPLGDIMAVVNAITQGISSLVALNEFSLEVCAQCM